MRKAILVTAFALLAGVALLSAPMGAEAFLFKQHQSAGVSSSGPQFTPTWNYTIDAGQPTIKNQQRGSSTVWYPSSPGQAGPGYSSGGSAAGYFSGNYR